MEVAMITVTNRQWMAGNIVDNVRRQILKPDLVVVAAHGVPDYPFEIIKELADDNIRVVTMHLPKEAFHLSCSNCAFETAAHLMCKAETGLLCVADDDDMYCPGYLGEAVEAFRQRPYAGVIGKSHYRIKWVGSDKPPTDDGDYIGIEPLTEVDWVAGPTICISLHAWRKYPLKLRFDPFKYHNNDVVIIKAVGELGLLMFTTTPDNFYLQQYTDSKHAHKWKRSYDG